MAISLVLIHPGYLRIHGGPVVSVIRLGKRVVLHSHEEIVRTTYYIHRFTHHVITATLVLPTAMPAANDYVGPILALIGAIFGGMGVKYVDKIFSFREKKTDIASKIQDELRIEIKELKGVIKELDHQLDTVQRAYYKVLIKYNMLRERLNLPSDLEDEELDAKISRMTKEIENAKITFVPVVAEVKKIEGDK